ncbi:MAG TPA: AAA family ATPase, partial [Longimicrobium sp.]
MPRRKPPIPVYFTGLKITNVRCFGASQRLDLTSEKNKPARWTLILGDNGVGKTTLLQCLAWMRLVPESGFELGAPQQGDDRGDPPPLAKGRLGPALLDEENETLESLLRVGHDADLTLAAELSFGGALTAIGGNSAVAPEAGKTIRTGVQLYFAKRLLSDLKYLGRPSIERRLNGEFHEPLIVTYGANRQLGVQNLVTGDLDDPADAFRLSNVTELYDLEEIFSALDYATQKVTGSREEEQLKRLVAVLVRILPEELSPSDITISPPDVLDRAWKPSEVRVRTFSGWVPMSALSLGYRTTLAWTMDLAWRLLKRYPASPDPLAEPAVVLIDEIDLHLHPLWQLRLIDALSTMFPGTQFVATAHSPLMVQVAETANLVLLRKREADVEIVNDPEVVRSWRVDQILTSELFEVPRARNKQTELLFARRDLLVDNLNRSAAEEAELRAIRAQIADLPTAPDPEAQEAMAFVRETAALIKKHRLA